MNVTLSNQISKLIKTLKGHSSDVNSLALLKDGRFISGSDDKSVILWKKLIWKICEELERMNWFNSHDLDSQWNGQKAKILKIIILFKINYIHNILNVNVVILFKTIDTNNRYKLF